MFFCQLIYVTTSFQRYINQQIQQCPLPKVSQRSPESLSAASFDTTMRKTMRNEKNRLKCDSERFREVLLVLLHCARSSLTLTRAVQRPAILQCTWAG